MTMLDKSDFAPLVPIGTDGDKEIARLEKEEGIGATMRDEDFVTGGECERGEWKLELGKEEDGMLFYIKYINLLCAERRICHYREHLRTPNLTCSVDDAHPESRHTVPRSLVSQLFSGIIRDPYPRLLSAISQHIVS